MSSVLKFFSKHGIIFTHQTVLKHISFYSISSIPWSYPLSRFPISGHGLGPGGRLYFFPPNSFHSTRPPAAAPTTPNPSFAWCSVTPACSVTCWMRADTVSSTLVSRVLILQGFTVCTNLCRLKMKAVKTNTHAYTYIFGGYIKLGIQIKLM